MALAPLVTRYYQTEKIQEGLYRINALICIHIIYIHIIYFTYT